MNAKYLESEGRAMGITKSCPPPIPAVFKTHSVKEALEAAYDLIGNKRHWIQHAMAAKSNRVDEYGDVAEEVLPKDPKAQAFCALGALVRVNGRFQTKATMLLEKAANYILGDETYRMQDNPVVEVNDELGYAEVRKMFRLAIK